MMQVKHSLNFTFETMANDLEHFHNIKDEFLDALAPLIEEHFPDTIEQGFDCTSNIVSTTDIVLED